MDLEEEKQRRYSPEVRRTMILDHTADIINSDGLSNLTMESISRTAGISKSLMYKYFESLTALLKELLDRELKAQRRLQFEAAENAESFEELVRNITHQYLKYIDDRGLILERLQAEPSISELHDPTDYGRAGAVAYLTPIVSKTFDLPMDLASAITDISFGLPSAAGHYLQRGDMSLEEIEDITSTMIIGTLVAARDNYMTRKKKLVR